jgi:nucleoside-diphosphate-sugar epimerase
MRDEIRMAVAVAGMLGAAHLAAASEHDTRAPGAAQAALRYFEAVEGGDFERFLCEVQPEPLSPATRSIVIRNLPPEGELRPSPREAAKLAAEVVATQLSRVGSADAVVARSFNHTGPGQSTRFALGNWAEQLGRIAGGSAEPVLRVGNLQARRDWLDVRDVVRAYIILAEAGSPGEIYNVCSGHSYSLEDLARMMIEATGLDIELVVERSRLRPADIPLLMGDPTRLEALGWRPRVPLRQTLGDLLGSAEVVR